MRTLDNTAASIVRRLPSSASVHCILTVSLLLDTSAFLTAWKSVMPSSSDLLASMPIAWPSSLQKLLPCGASKALNRQRSKFAQDWCMVQSTFPEVAHDDFLHAWLLVNTRSFHHSTRATKHRASRDQMILQPIADLFNHDALGPGCRVSFGAAGFSVYADRPYEAGEEVIFSYGRHPNDTLLVDYGFVVPEGNPWDEILVDDCVMPLLSPERQDWLQEHNLLGRYIVDTEKCCYRTDAAIRASLLTKSRWTRFVAGEPDDNKDDSNDIMTRLDQVWQGIINNALHCAHAAQVALGSHALDNQHPLVLRWKQVIAMLQNIDYSCTEPASA